MSAPRALEIIVGDERLAALDFGGRDGAPLVVLLHGFPDHADSFTAVAAALVSAGYRCVAPYLRGYAPSTCRGPFSLERLRDDALAVIDALSPSAPARLVGHDWGALVTYAACAAAPTRIARAVAMSVPAPMTFLRQLVTSRQLARSWYMLFFQLGAADRLARAGDFALVDWLWRRWSPALRLPDEARRALHTRLAASWPAPLAPYRALLEPRTLRQRFAELASWRIEVPLTQLCGGDDGCIAPAATAAQRTWLGPGFSQIVFPRLGHFLHLEAPGQIAGEIVRALA